jgi:hypothetical protein
MVHKVQGFSSTGERERHRKRERDQNIANYAVKAWFARDNYLV